MKDRTHILNALKTMPDEAFSWFVQACLPSNITHNSSIWPDGIGGFSQESRKSIEAVREAADDLFIR